MAQPTQLTWDKDTQREIATHYLPLHNDLVSIVSSQSALARSLDFNENTHILYGLVDLWHQQLKSSVSQLSEIYSKIPFEYRQLTQSNNASIFAIGQYICRLESAILPSLEGYLINTEPTEAIEKQDLVLFRDFSRDLVKELDAFKDCLDTQYAISQRYATTKPT